MRDILLTALLTLTALGHAQDTLHTTTTLVVVPTLVQTHTQQVVYALTAEDFALTDNGAPQKIKLEAASSQPLSLVVLIQTGHGAEHVFQQYRGLETMLASLLENGPESGHAPNQVAIVNFDSKPEAASPFTSNIAEWTDAINHPDSGDSGAAILDGLAYSLRLLVTQPASNRRAILLISQPADSGSKTTLKEILHTTAETNTTIYTLTFSPEMAAIKEALKGPERGNRPLFVGDSTYVAYFDLTMPLNLLLSSLQKNLSANISALTGGETATFGDQHSLEDRLSDLANHIRNRYLLTFQPASPRPGLHQLEVRLPAHPDLTISTRSSYWSAESQPPVPR